MKSAGPALAILMTTATLNIACSSGLPSDSNAGGATASGGKSGGSSHTGGTAANAGGTGTSSTQGGAASTGGLSSAGTSSTGGSKAMGGATNSGTSAGTTSTGGTTAIGGTAALGGATALGGNAITGGTGAATGGLSTTGGSTTTGTGGQANTGGTGATGGAMSTGGTITTGGAASTGGTSSTGGTATTGGATTTCGTSPVPVALFHFDGTDGSTVLTDSSGTSKVAVITGNPAVSTAQSKFGMASLYINGNSTAHTNYVRSDGGSDFQFPGDFAIDWWQFTIQYTDTWGSLVGLITPGDENSCSTCVGLGWNSGGANVHSIRYPSDSVTAPPNNSWHHIALTRSGTIYRVFIDGTIVATDSGIAGTIGGNMLEITGASANSDNGDISGYFDELRVVKGCAVWTSNFTPPTTPYQ